MKYLYFFVLIIFLSSCDTEDDIIIPKLDEYDLEVISYFKEIALGFEFGSASKITRKWCSDLKIFVGGEPTSDLLKELDDIISDITELSTDNFNIEIVGDSSLSNYYIFFGKGDDYSKIFPSVSSYINSNWGLFFIWWDSLNCLNRGHMYIDIFRADFIEQKHLLREELTQSLGLARDSDRYVNSIFQSSWTQTLRYSDLDEDIIRLLYHPMMSNGLDVIAVDGVLREILISEK